MNTLTFGFIGTGNMGGALAKAAAKAAYPVHMYLADFNAEKSLALAREIGGIPSTNQDIARKCQYIFLGVKAQIMADMLFEIAPFLLERADEFVLVSMAAGITIRDIQTMAGGKYPVIRIMPNTPVSVGEGMILYTVSEEVTPDMVKTFQEKMQCAGVLDLLPEQYIDAGCAVSGCGPAFVYMFIEALADGGVECGLPRDKALLYAAQTLYGASKLVLESKKHPGELKDAVCSPGGTTIAGVHALETGGFRNCAMNAVCKAHQKTKELGKK